MAMNAVAGRGVSIALACRAFQISETCYRYSPVLSDENAEIADWLERLTENKRSWGFGLCFLYLRNVQGYAWNHKRVYRIYCELELNLRIKPKKRLKRDKPEPLAVPEVPNDTWSIIARQHMHSMCERGFHGGSTCGWPLDPDIKRTG
jgi:putative transposase